MHKSSQGPTTSPPQQDGLAQDRSSAAGGDSPETTRRLADDHDRIAEGLNDVVVRRLFSAGLALEAALGLIGEHRAVGKIEHAISELDQAIADLRGTVFDAPMGGPRGAGSAG
jgi:signal transduction histidine kinase